MGWHGMMRHGRTIFPDHDPSLKTLNEEEKETLTSCAGVILSEDSNGFVYVKYFDAMSELDEAWAKIEQENSEDDEQKQE